MRSSSTSKMPGNGTADDEDAVEAAAPDSRRRVPVPGRGRRGSRTPSSVHPLCSPRTSRRRASTAATAPTACYDTTSVGPAVPVRGRSRDAPSRPWPATAGRSPRSRASSLLVGDPERHHAGDGGGDGGDRRDRASAVPGGVAGGVPHHQRQPPEDRASTGDDQRHEEDHPEDGDERRPGRWRARRPWRRTRTARCRRRAAPRPTSGRCGPTARVAATAGEHGDDVLPRGEPGRHDGGQQRAQQPEGGDDRDQQPRARRTGRTSSPEALDDGHQRPPDHDRPARRRAARRPHPGRPRRRARPGGPASACHRWPPSGRGSAPGGGHRRRRRARRAARPRAGPCATISATIASVVAVAGVLARNCSATSGTGGGSSMTARESTSGAERVELADLVPRSPAPPPTSQVDAGRSQRSPGRGCRAAPTTVGVSRRGVTRPMPTTVSSLARRVERCRRRPRPAVGERVVDDDLAGRLRRPARASSSKSPAASGSGGRPRWPSVSSRWSPCGLDVQPLAHRR